MLLPYLQPYLQPNSFSSPTQLILFLQNQLSYHLLWEVFSKLSFGKLSPPGLIGCLLSVLSLGSASPSTFLPLDSTALVLKPSLLLVSPNQHGHRAGAQQVIIYLFFYLSTFKLLYVHCWGPGIEPRPCISSSHQPYLSRMIMFLLLLRRLSLREVK